MALKMIQKYMTKNDCYKTGRKIKVKGLFVHSTAVKGVMAARWYELWNKPGISKCVHGFLDDKEFYQYLPWNHRAWHGGGSSNDTHIGIEWCEPADYSDKEYFDKVWANGVELYAKLCKMFGLKASDIIAHYEGYKLGIASNHGDPAHWWKYQGKTMDMFRADVAAAMKAPAKAEAAKPVSKPEAPKPTPTPTPAPAAKGDMKTTSIVDYLVSIKADSSFSNRAKLAAQNGIKGYTGTPEQNTKLLGILRGQTAKPAPAPAPAKPAAPKPASKGDMKTLSVVDYLKSIGQDSSMGARKKLATQYGIKNYTGTPAQNELLLKKLRG